MSEPLSQHVLGRLVTYFFFGVTALLALLLGLSLTIERLTPSDLERPLLLFAAAQAFAVSAAWWFVPWGRWSRRAHLGLLPFGSGIIATVQFGVPSVALVMAVFYLVLVAFVGLSQEPGWPTAFAPLAGAAFAVPLTVMHRWDLGVATVAIVVTSVVCLLGGEVLAWMSSNLRRSYVVEIRRLADMQELLHASTRLSHQVDASEAADLVAELAGKLLHADAVVVLLLDATGALSGAGSWQWPRDAAELILDLTGAPQLRDVLSSGLPATIFDDNAFGGQDGVFEHPVTTIVFPLRGTGGTVGVVAAVSLGGAGAPDIFTENVGQTFAAQAGLAFERAWATESLRDATLRDELTGLGNRRHATAVLAQLHPGDAVAMIDLDHFKRVNDELGHAGGDGLLRSFGDYLRSALREHDVAARYGGDEFLVVFRQIRDSVGVTSSRFIEGWRATDPLASLSVGIAVHESGVTPIETVERADTALYHAKEAGRDQVVIYDSTMVTAPS